MSHIQIAVDGPAGAGKSTIAKLIAKELNYIYVHTGAMYRAITLKAIKLHIDLSDDTKYDFIDDTKFEFIDDLLYMDDTNVEHEIREAIITNNVSLVSSHLSVRERLVQRQFDMAQNNNVVMDGRDIGYKVLPNARFKFFLTASIEERANRRHKENVSRNIKSDIHVIEEEIKKVGKGRENKLNLLYNKINDE